MAVVRSVNAGAGAVEEGMDAVAEEQIPVMGEQIAVPPKPVHKKRHRKYRDSVSGLLMSLPPLVGFFFFGLIPQIISLWLSFQEAHSFDFSAAEFVGFANYAKIFSDKEFYLALGNTLFYMIPTFVCIGLGLLIAVLISNKGLRGKKFFRSVFFIPYVCSVVATTVMWYWFFETDYGILNGILTSLFGENAKVGWLTSEWPFRFAMMFMLIWSGCGYNIILYQSAIASVDQSLYESAEIDGATGWQKFTKITWPMVMPTTFFMFIMGVIHGLQAFTVQQVWGEQVSLGREPALTAVYYIYLKAWTQPSVYGMGYASAASWIVAVLIGIVTLINFKLKNRRNQY